MRAHERAGEVGVDHRVPFGGAELVRRLADIDAGIVDQNVEPAVLLRDAVDQRAAGFLVRHVDFANSALPPASLICFTARRALGGVAPGEHHDRARRRQPLGHAEPDAAIAAGDDRDAAGEIEQAHVLPPLCYENGRRVPAN